MKENDKKLKDLFRDKNLENAFSPDEQNWKKMAAVLENEKKGNKRGLIYISLLLLLGGLGSALYFGLSASAPSADLVSLAGKAEQKPAAQIIESTESVVSPDKQIQSSKPLPKGNEIKQNNDPNSPETEKSAISKPTAPSATKELKNEQVIPVEKPTQTDVAESSQAKNQNVKSSVAGEVPKPELQVPAENNTSESIATKDPVKEDNTTTALSDLNLSLTESSKNETKPEEKNSVASEPKIPSVSTNTIVTETKLFPELMFMRTATPEERETALMHEIAYPINDSMIYKPLPTHRIYLEAGTSYMMGWNKGSEGKGFSPLAGLQYYHDINKRTGLSLGVMYTSIDHLSNTSHTSTTTHLKFGEEADVTVISAVKMHYLLLPLKLNYALSRNDFVGFGYTLAWLLDAESNVEEFQTRQNYVSTTVVSKSMGYTKGFSTYDGQITACYRRRLYKELYLSGELFYGLKDIKNNAIYQTGKFERNLGFRISLGINLWKK